MSRSSELLLIEQVRATALALPLVTERISHGSPSWFIERSPMIASLDDHHHGADHLSLWCPAGPGEQEARIAEDPDRWFRPPYVGPSGWVGLRLTPDLPWTVVEDLLEDAWELLVKPAQRRRSDS